MQPATAPNPIGCLVQQQDEILAQAHRTCRDDRSLQFPAEIEAIVHKAAVIMHSKGDEFAKPLFAVGGVPLDRSPEDRQEVGN